MKSGLQNSPALSVPWFLARQQPIAHKFPEQGRSGIAQKRVLAGNENFFDESRIVNQINMLREKAEVGNGSIALRGLFEELKRPGCIPSSKETKNFMTTRTRRSPHARIFARIS